MLLKYEGKTKDIYELENGNYLLKFKDTATGEDGKFDPGANTVGLTIEGMGNKSLIMSTYFFKLIEEAGIKTQFISSDISNNTMTVKYCRPFGEGLEVICRYRATGSFMRRYGKYASEGDILDSLVEMTLKDDDRSDPLVTEDTLVELDILESGEYKIVKELCIKTCEIIKKDLENKGLELYDIKLEFGRSNGEIILMDEVSSGNMRVYKDGEILDPIKLAEYYI